MIVYHLNTVKDVTVYMYNVIGLLLTPTTNIVNNICEEVNYTR